VEFLPVYVFGHRKIDIARELKQKVNNIIKDLMVNRNALTFLFRSRIDYLSKLIVT